MILNSGRESNNEIYTYLLPFLTWNRKWLKQSSFYVHDFNSTPSITPSDICSYLFPHLGPLIVWLQVMIHLTTTRMDGQLRGMGFRYNLVLKLSVLRHN
jgi:hypothetical protein